MPKINYETNTTVWNSMTGEITEESQMSIKRVDDEDDYIKIYRYFNTIFAFQNINPSLIPALIEISSYMTYADKGQKVVLYKSLKEEICNTLNIKSSRLEKIIRELKEADVLRPEADRGVYAVNPFVVGRGKWSDIKQLRASFDLVTGEIEAKSVIKDKITGETIAQLAKNDVSKFKGQIPGQLDLEL